MDAYPPDYVVHNLPFIVLSGLGTTKELDPPPPVQHVLPGRAVTTINSEISSVVDDRANVLLEEFLAADATNAPWNGPSSSRRGLTHGFRIRTVGRVGQAPRKMPREGTPG
jgi:solute carrier family 25 protein 38